MSFLQKSMLLCFVVIFSACTVAPTKTDLKNFNLPKWEKSAKELRVSSDAAFKKATKSLNVIANLSKNKLTFQNTMAAIDEIYYELDQVAYRVGLISSTSNNKKMRELARELEVEFSKYYVDATSRVDVYQTIQAYADTRPSLTGEDERLLEETLRDFKRIGFHLPRKTQDKIRSLKKRLSELENKVSNNINIANKVKIEFTREELEGLNADQLESVTNKENGKFEVAVGVTYQILAVLKNAKKEETRKKMSLARLTRAKKENKLLTESIIKKRAELAELLGYNSWADYKIEIKMAKDGKTAMKFVDGMIAGLDKKFQNEIEVLRQLKAKETGNKNAVINSWDSSYYTQMLEKTKYDLDLSGLKKYFSYDKTLQGMFDVFSKIFKLKIEFVDAPYVWDEKVKLARISDARDGRHLGFLYLDMFPRPKEEKYGHFAQFTIRPGKIVNGKKIRPIAALVCNFPEASADKPSLLSFRNVETLFHEFGHALHTILSETKYSAFAGTSVPRDFVEAPSQMLESWVNDKGVLASFAVNYANEHDKFPIQILEKIEKANLATIASMYRRQLSFGKMDLQMHMEIKKDSNFNIIKMTNKVLKDVSLGFAEGSSFITAFGHLFGGYDAGYYGYAWSDNLAADMSSVFEKSSNGFLDEEIGLRLREEIYQTGSSRDASASIEAFLGRKSNNKAFLKKLGL